MAEYFASAARGLEQLVESELVSMGATDTKIIGGGVRFQATQAQSYHICLWSRFASRILLKLSSFEIHDIMDLYLAANYIHWEDWFHVGQTFAVHCSGTNQIVNNSQFGALKVKDAIVDRFSTKCGQRPSVDRQQADIRIVLHIHREQAALFLDLAGEPLHQRGYREVQGKAPLKENLAAGIAARANWQQAILLDPMCGAGTLLIEAFMQKADIAPGAYRDHYALEDLSDFDPATWTQLRAEVQSRSEAGKNQCQQQLFGYDIDANMVKMARRNVQRAGLAKWIQIDQGDAKALINPVPEVTSGLILSNPPYGERLDEVPALTGLFSQLGRQLKEYFPSWRVALLSSSVELLDYLRLRSDKQYKFSNGPLDCTLKLYQLSDVAVKASEQRYAQDFINRLKKNQKKLAKWLEREGIECYRIYDADLPEYNMAVDRYQDYWVIQEYQAPKSIDPKKASQRLFDAVTGISESGLADASKVIVKQRQRQQGRAQYQKIDEQKNRLVVEEYGAKLYVNLRDYLDTGLFLDHRNMRHWLAQHSQGKRVLNLFAYTGSASVHAALGGATLVTTIDMSKTYLNWAMDNFRLNHLTISDHEFIRADCLKWLALPDQRQFDLIFLDPPTFSNSKKMEGTFDVQRDHMTLIKQAMSRLSEDGTLVFSNNKRQFKLDVEAMAETGFEWQDVSSMSLPLDFERNKSIHRCWLIHHVQAK
ncbi:bifunctional 23S rRNA (guanine(2069)-N(7))-methyltransferase RlmK/23S rRNA (guanine(2445)-N(2))-methyltransferase RlmL [Celerinatantimonas sp. YJH-8]|uniref:bifunctional 23S rRNA (guanine(2069)-N(7))-methyltransferase RlmK/23S rRNA (guanine(2445)-N(2))-methyltransferase RlmL n=1 Tax=Celerinatantimonas sp. YJH-8 TaxID=3228714 RepID=UPI0038C48921